MDDKRGALMGLGIAVIVALVAAALWFGVLRKDEEAARPGMREGDPASDAADDFALAWQTGKLAKVPATKSSGDVAARTAAITEALGATSGRPVTVTVTGIERVEPLRDGDPDRIAAGLRVTWQLDAERTWSYDSKVELVEGPAAGGDDPTWQVDWVPSVVHQRLVEGDRLTALRAAAKRGEILGLDGEPLVGLRPVVVVGIQPGATTDRAAAAQQVAGIVGVDAGALADRVTKAGADEFVSAITLREAAFAEVESSLRAIPGVVLREDEIPLAPTRDFARALIGSVGAATAEVAAASEGRIVEGEQAGLSGLQGAQDEVLGGTAGISVRVVSSVPDKEPYELKAFPATPGRSITVTLDPRVQAAADEVMAQAPKPAALVAIRVSTGDVLAVANGPAGADGYNRAMIGKYPPGSTFKVASALTLLEDGLTPDTPVDCPATIVVGKEFSNAEGEVLGTVPFRKDFADSCNTAFVGQSRTITAQQLAEVAASLGYRPLDLGVPVFGGSVPVTDSETEHAANMIGQGKVEASPFAVALASASVAAGRSVQPRLIVDPKDPKPQPGAALPATAIRDLQGLMRGVVTGGTGSAVLGIPGGDVSGKTGTAEFGTEDPPQTHAWFTGFQGDVAFAVLVEDGGFGGQVAAPLAARFLTAIAE